jgi:hypothetical protein
MMKKRLLLISPLGKKGLMGSDFYPSIIKRIWGNGTRYNFFYPVNYGYRQSIKKALSDDAIGGKWR